MDSDDQDYVGGAGSGVMVSNLPLLFARGRPACLQDMTLSDLEVFVPFMVRCSLGEEQPVPWSQLPRPSWWPKRLPFRMPTASNTAATRTALVDLVDRCYMFHGCQYLIQFCASLVSQMSSSGYRFNDNRDGTTSMYHGSTGKLLVTFRNENRDYDKFNHDRRSSNATHKKLLLSPSPHTGERRGSSGTTPAMCQPAAVDIYLCDRCENEFYSLKEVQAHEKNCRGDVPSSPAVPSPEPDLPEDEPEAAGQVPFLSYFNLQPAKHTGLEPYMSPRKKTVPSPPRKTFSPSYPRYDTIELASPLGKFLLANSKIRYKYQAAQYSVMRYERHLHATPNAEITMSKDRCSNRWIVVWRNRKEDPQWTHTFCFNKAQRRERKITINTGLDWRSRRLLSKCKSCQIDLERLPKRLVDRVMRLGGPNVPCIDLTDEPTSVFVTSSLVGVTPPTYEQLNSVSQDKHNQWENADYKKNCTAKDPLDLGPSSSSVNDQWMYVAQQGNGNAYLVSEDANPTASLGDMQYAVANKGSLRLKQIPINTRTGFQSGTVDYLSGTDNHQGVWNQQSVDQNPKLAQISDGHLSRRKPLNCDGISSVQPMKSPPPVSISLVPINSQASISSGKSQNKNVYGTYHRQNHMQNFNHSDQSNLRGQSNCLQTPSTLGMPQASQTTPSQSVPVKSGVKKSRLLVNDANVSLSSFSLPVTTSSIEIIDLSSDDDDNGRSPGHSEAANAPQQLDGLQCYPHTGAKVPHSKHSRPKNGDSHWSPNKKSHCGAGRVGDLATNGQPLNVLPSAAVSPNLPSAVSSPVPHIMFLPTSVSVPITQGTIGSSVKRRIEDPPPVGGKVVILDISKNGVRVSTPEEIINTRIRVSEENTARGETRTMNFPDEFTPATPEDLNSDFLPYPERTVSNACEDQSSAFRDKQKYLPTHRRIHLDDEISFKIPNSDYSHLHQHQRHVEFLNVKDQGGHNLSDVNKGLKGGSVPRDSVSGFITNIVSTVNKGMEFIKSLVVTGSNELKGTNKTDNSSSEWFQSKFLRRESLVHKSDYSNVLTTHERISNKSLEVPETSRCPYTKRKRNSEVNSLLGDECRELKRKGLGDLKGLDLQNARMTRGSVERLIPSTARRKGTRSNRQPVTANRDTRKNTCDVNIVNNASEVAHTKVDDKKRSVTTDIMGKVNVNELETVSGKEYKVIAPSIQLGNFSGCMDENGNSSFVGLENVERCVGSEISNKKLNNYSEVNVYGKECDVSVPRLGGCASPPSGSSLQHLSDRENKLVTKLSQNNTAAVLKQKKEDGLVDKASELQTCTSSTKTSPNINRNLMHGARELRSLAVDEWKEMSKKGFHREKIIKRAFREAGKDATCFNLGNHSGLPASKTSTLKRELKALGNAECEIMSEPQNEKPKVTKELRNPANDECKESSHLISFHLVKALCSTGTEKGLSHGDISTADVQSSDDRGLSSSSFKPEISPELMGKTAEEGGALQAQIPQSEKLSNRHSLNNQSSLNITNGKWGSEKISDADQRADKKQKHPKKWRGLRELQSLGNDEWKEMRDTGFHPLEIVGSGSKVMYFGNSSDDDDDDDDDNAANNDANDNAMREVEEEGDDADAAEDKEKEEQKKQTAKMKISRELARLFVDECKELNKRKGGKQLKPSFRNGLNEHTVKRLQKAYMNGSSNRMCRSSFRGPQPNPQALLPIPMLRKPSLESHTRSSRSQANVVSVVEVFTPRDSHRQLLQTEKAMCVVNFSLPNIA